MTKLKLLNFIFILSITTMFKVCDGHMDLNLISGLEKQFLSGLGVPKRPRSIKTNIQIPDDVIEMYFMKTGIKVEDSMFEKRREKGS